MSEEKNKKQKYKAMSDPLYVYLGLQGGCKCIMHNKGIHAHKNEKHEFLSDLNKRKKLRVYCFIKILSEEKKSFDGTMSEGKNKKH